MYSYTCTTSVSYYSNDRRMALIQMGSTEEATAALIVSETYFCLANDPYPYETLTKHIVVCSFMRICVCWPSLHPITSGCLFPFPFAHCFICHDLSNWWYVHTLVQKPTCNYSPSSLDWRVWLQSWKVTLWMWCS